MVPLAGRRGNLRDRGLAVNAIFARCPGQAHEPGVVQDNCSLCAPFWNRIACCATCTTPKRAVPLALSKSRVTGRCPECHARATVRRDGDPPVFAIPLRDAP